MEDAADSQTWKPEWLTPDAVHTVIVAFPDVYGRLMGKRLSYEQFVEHAAHDGVHYCNYLLTVDVAMDPQSGFELASWDKGYGDFLGRVDLTTLRQLPWEPGTAVALADLYHEDGRPVMEVPRHVLRQQVDRLAGHGMQVRVGSELEFFLFEGGYRTAAAKDFRDLQPTSDYIIDYHILHSSRDQGVLGRIRNEMNAAGITVEGSKGEWGRGQYEVNLRFGNPMSMADCHVLYKMGAKQIADQEGRALTFMAKWDAEQAGSSFHLHSSLWDSAGATNLFWDTATGEASQRFRQFLGGLLAHSRELAYFFAPTVNSYKRYQASSWAPTRLVWDRDNRTCGFRIVGDGSSFRIENRIPEADGNPYLAFAATIAAGLQGIEQDLDCGEPYHGNAYENASLPLLPGSLREAADLLEGSKLANAVFGPDVVEFYVRTARIEDRLCRNAVTDWERRRYFEQL